MQPDNRDLFERLKGDLVIIQFRTLLSNLKESRGLIPNESIENIDKLIRKEMAIYIFKTYPQFILPDNKYSGKIWCYFSEEIFLN